MASKSASARNGRDSAGQRRGVKAFDGEFVTGGSIIVRQVGQLFHPGLNVGLGKDYTIYSKIDGFVKFESYGHGKKRVNVRPAPVVEVV